MLAVCSLLVLIGTASLDEGKQKVQMMGVVESLDQHGRLVPTITHALRYRGHQGDECDDVILNKRCDLWQYSEGVVVCVVARSRAYRHCGVVGLLMSHCGGAVVDVVVAPAFGVEIASVVGHISDVVRSLAFVCTSCNRWRGLWNGGQFARYSASELTLFGA